jgi:hypothetical protein
MSAATNKKWGVVLVSKIAPLMLIVATLVMQPMYGVVQALQTTNYTSVDFTTSEVAAWSADRTTPSGGYSSLPSYSGRSNVLELNIDKDKQSNLAAFHHTEGIQRQIPASDSIKADLYVDADWTTNSKTVRAGLWGVGKNAANAISAYPIIEFTTDGFTGWRAYNSNTGAWQNISAATAGWHTLEITHNKTTNAFDYKINGTTVHSYDDNNSVAINALILNNKNYGASSQSYDVHWDGYSYGQEVLLPKHPPTYD